MLTCQLRANTRRGARGKHQWGLTRQAPGTVERGRAACRPELHAFGSTAPAHTWALPAIRAHDELSSVHSNLEVVLRDQAQAGPRCAHTVSDQLVQSPEPPATGPCPAAPMATGGSLGTRCGKEEGSALSVPTGCSTRRCESRRMVAALHPVSGGLERCWDQQNKSWAGRMISVPMGKMEKKQEEHLELTGWKHLCD